MAGFFVLAVCTLMLHAYFHSASNDPWKSPQLLALKERLLAEPKNETLKNQIRKLDYEFRIQFRRRLAKDRSGRWLLLGGAVIVAMSAKKAFALKTPLHHPKYSDKAPNPQDIQSRAIRAVAVAGGVVTVALTFVSIAFYNNLPGVDSEMNKTILKTDVTENIATKYPSVDEMQRNWPSFRGWNSCGVTAFTNAPISWDGIVDRNVAWKSPIPLRGNSSPVIWNNQVFLSGATTNDHEIFSYELLTGRLLWRCDVSHIPGNILKDPEVGESTGMAASTGATDGRRFFAIFANGDLTAINVDGSIAWSKVLGPIRNTYGHASSLALRDGVLIIQLDQGESSKTFSKLLALDAATGRTLWERSRPVPASWASPIIIKPDDKMQIITLGEPWVISYSFADGTELWRAELLQNEIVPSPVFASGFIIAASPSTKVVALRADGAGEVSRTAVVWNFDENVPDITSPVSCNGLVFVVNSGGGLTCIDALDGKKTWNHELKLDVQASPSIMGNRLLVLSENGIAVQIEVGREFKELSRSTIPDKFIASPAFADGAIVLRGETNLYCIRSGTPQRKGALANARN